MKAVKQFEQFQPDQLHISPRKALLLLTLAFFIVHTCLVAGSAYQNRIQARKSHASMMLACNEYADIQKQDPCMIAHRELQKGDYAFYLDVFHDVYDEIKSHIPLVHTCTTTSICEHYMFSIIEKWWVFLALGIAIYLIRSSGYLYTQPTKKVE